MSDRKKIALVIGWGSVKCAAALGLLHVLSKAGIEVDMVVASGRGSIFETLGFDFRLHSVPVRNFIEQPAPGFVRFL